jgi:hypothetical protein
MPRAPVDAPAFAPDSGSDAGSARKSRPVSESGVFGWLMVAELPSSATGPFRFRAGLSASFRKVQTRDRIGNRAVELTGYSSRYWWSSVKKPLSSAGTLSGESRTGSGSSFSGVATVSVDRRFRALFARTDGARCSAAWRIFSFRGPVASKCTMGCAASSSEGLPGLM